jgi:hypothetical protein
MRNVHLLLAMAMQLRSVKSIMQRSDSLTRLYQHVAEESDLFEKPQVVRVVVFAGVLVGFLESGTEVEGLAERWRLSRCE